MNIIYNIDLFLTFKDRSGTVLHFIEIRGDANGLVGTVSSWVI